MHSTKNNLQILFEDNHLIVINKRSGDITQGDKTGDKPLSDVVKEYIKDNENKPGNVYLGVVHRLDRPTSGIVIFAKTSKALERLNKALRDKKIHKTYWAVVNKIDIPNQQTLTHFLVKNPKNNKSSVCKANTQGAKEAILHYKLVKKLDNFQLLEIELETGRHHQIRVQLSTMDCTIKGDLKYGAKRSNKDGSIHLHARKITFIHPVKKEPITLIAPVPDDAVWKNCEN
ncbi:RluA family pseudouridine synthase [Wenyingzhuangia sp. 2_MG-2023]|uniref:RluA family pseudouridine synthase n=1 Tax=Wenyingzhuangia sp. 2_MG-2023 TaxID=3062639 RepID=UPI0026E40808|nr:RluA family pseudouridine synthase [Wenyingzhuangia sp. 2_MG-2023]MDO6737703.1 RluA family pseudouridine synthase [Wenyingzhuangia sp. 2_MG-2023]